jgi:hypothetical protein
MCARRAEDSSLPKHAAIVRHVSVLPLLGLFGNVLFYFTQVQLALFLLAETCSRL